MFPYASDGKLLRRCRKQLRVNRLALATFIIAVENFLRPDTIELHFNAKRYIIRATNELL